jgi:hypothetical protein
MTIKRSSITLFVATAFAGLGVAWTLRSAGCMSSSTLPPPSPIADTAAVEHLSSIVEFLEPANETERAAIVTEISDTLRRRISQSKAAPDPRDQILIRLVAERVRLIMDPDYDRYLDQVTAWTGSDARQSVRGTMFESPELWNIFANAAKAAAIAPEGVLIRSGAETLADPESLTGGFRATLQDPGYYGSAALLAANAEVRDVVIPMMVYSPENPKGVVVYATIGFVWDRVRNTWVPYKTGVQDPVGSHTVTALWI